MEISWEKVGKKRKQYKNMGDKENQADKERR